MKDYNIENIKKLNNARTISESKTYVSSTGKTHSIIDPLVILIENDDIRFRITKSKKVGKITLEKNDSFSYVIVHKSEFTGRPLVLDFANPFVPGGCVRKGCCAQEEDLCRRSNLLKALESDDASNYYTVNKDIVTIGETPMRCLLVKDVTIFADSEGTLIDPIIVDVLVIAAPYKTKDKILDIDLENIIEMILDVAELYRYKDIILGAFGCGAFHNDPLTVASLFKYYLSSGSYSFDTVGFPILVKSEERDRPNWDAFSNQFNI